ncbi:hypothetical protein [Methylobacterium oryzae]|uniref:hypothetical protein n=1 Tax=Methylobacterium oryzae TaxID=334852 RepID=UPI002F35400C
MKIVIRGVPFGCVQIAVRKRLISVAGSVVPAFVGRSGCGARQQGLHHRREDAGNDEENRNSEDCRTAEHAPLDED